jgi:dTDP-4-dehydrorhamnose reductase
MILENVTINGTFGKKIIDKKNKIMKVYIIGHTGMLGKYVSTYLSDFYEIVNIGRKEIDVSKINEKELKISLINLGINENDVLINCAGTIKPRVDELGDLNAILVNSVFPRVVSNVCEILNVKMIHPTTDCVYTGNKGKYNENDKYDVNDIYGMSKALGEPKNCTVIRTSIIGEEVNQGRSLVEWVKSEKNNTVNGFTNHFWNGMTCLQFAIICKQIIDENLFWLGTKHLHSNTVNKKELVELISDIYELNLNVKSVEASNYCDRSISTIHETNILIPSLKTQIKDMKGFSKKLYKK